MSVIQQLNTLRNHGGPARTTGLPDETIEHFAAQDGQLVEAIETAHSVFGQLLENEPEFLELDEDRQIEAIQEGFVNFYVR